MARRAQDTLRNNIPPTLLNIEPTRATAEEPSGQSERISTVVSASFLKLSSLGILDPELFQVDSENSFHTFEKFP